jgi:hypothetical protein
MNMEIYRVVYYYSEIHMKKMKKILNLSIKGKNYEDSSEEEVEQVRNNERVSD